MTVTANLPHFFPESFYFLFLTPAKLS